MAIPSYRLMPMNSHPAQVEDAAAAFAWTRAHISDFGGDPERLYAGGHSSGGHLAALLALDEQYLKPYGLDASGIRGVISMSGVYNVDRDWRFRLKVSPAMVRLRESAAWSALSGVRRLLG